VILGHLGGEGLLLLAAGGAGAVPALLLLLRAQVGRLRRRR
jgi:hypothetical protein